MHVATLGGNSTSGACLRLTQNDYGCVDGERSVPVLLRCLCGEKLFDNDEHGIQS